MHQTERGTPIMYSVPFPIVSQSSALSVNTFVNIQSSLNTMAKLGCPSKYTGTLYWRPTTTARPTNFARYGCTCGQIGMHTVSGSFGPDHHMNMQSHESGQPCLWSPYGGTSNKWSSTTTINPASTLQPMPWLLRALHHIACTLIGLSGTPKMDVINHYKGSRSQSSMHGLLCTNAQPMAHINQMCRSGFAHAEHRSTIRTCCASTLSRKSTFLVLIGGQKLFGNTQHCSTTSTNYFQSICKKLLPALLLWACNIGLDKSLLW